MPKVNRNAIVAHTNQEMYALVIDVEAYPQFLPWCCSTRLLSRKPDQVCAEIEVCRMGIHQSFATCNRLVENQQVNIALTEGPFTRLDGAWRFTPLGATACKVELTLDFEFSGALINRAFGAIFGQIANTLVDSFCKRADALYGLRRPTHPGSPSHP